MNYVIGVLFLVAVVGLVYYAFFVKKSKDVSGLPPEPEPGPDVTSGDLKPPDDHPTGT